MFNTDPYRMRKYPASEERRMLAHFLKVTGRLTETAAGGKVAVERSGDIREDDPSIQIVEG